MRLVFTEITLFSDGDTNGKADKPVALEVE